MFMKESSVHVIEIGKERLDEAVEILTLAFENDPTSQYFFSDHDRPLINMVRELYRYICERQLAYDYPILGSLNNDRLSGVACVQPPGVKAQPNLKPEQYEKRFGSLIGRNALNRMMKHHKVTSTHLLDKLCYYLVALGVHPDEQGQGYGRALLDAVHDIVDLDADSIGTSLDTTNPVNAPMYEHFRFQVIAEDNVDNALDVWIMFRLNRATTECDALSQI